MNKRKLVSKVQFGRKICNLCEGKLIKHAFTSSGKTRFKWSNCNKTKVGTTLIMLINQIQTKRLFNSQNFDYDIIEKNGFNCKKDQRPVISKGKIYEVDEICTYIKQKNYLANLCLENEF